MEFSIRQYLLRAAGRLRLFHVLGLVLFAWSGGHAWAICASGSRTVFSCMTAQEKRIEVCESGAAVAYSFGNPQSRPEIVVRVPVALASRSQWSGARRWNFYALDVPSGATTYNIFWGSNALAGLGAQEGGVNVVQGDTVTATVLCAPQTIVQALDMPAAAARALARLSPE